MFKTNKTFLFYALILFSSSVVLYVNFTSDSTYDTGDGLQHYLISKYSWQHPELLLNLWGKPFFTLLSSPFSHFGLNGMYVFQVICAAFTCIFLFKIATLLQIKNAFIIPVLVFFAPIYFAVLNTGLTEICFSCFFTFSIWLLFKHKYNLAAVVASTIPFIRHEALVLLPLILIVLIARKKYKSIPLLFSAFAVYTFIGYLYFHNFWWILSENKKLMGENYVDMKGSIFHYVLKFRSIISTFCTGLLLIGLFAFFKSVRLFFKSKIAPRFFVEEITLIYGYFFGCILLHSILFSIPGLLNNLGLLRYLTTIVPCAALIILRGVNQLLDSPFFKTSFQKNLVLICILILTIRSPFKQWYYPFWMTNEQLVIKKAGTFIRPILKNKMICYLHPFFPLISNIDPFDVNRTQLIWSVEKDKLNLLPDSTLIVWDSHFSPQEGKLALSTLLQSPYFMPIKQFRYYNYKRAFEVWIFEKTNDCVKSNRLPPITIVYDKPK